MTTFQTEIKQAEELGRKAGLLFGDWDLDRNSDFETMVTKLYNSYGSGIVIRGRLKNFPDTYKKFLKDIWSKNYIGFYQSSNFNDKSIMDYVQAFNLSFAKHNEKKYVKFVIETRGNPRDRKIPWNVDSPNLRDENIVEIYLYDFLVD